MNNLQAEWDSATPANEWDNATPVTQDEWDTSAPVKPEEGFFSRVGSDIKKRWNTTTDPNFLRPTFESPTALGENTIRLGGQMAGVANDVIAQGLRSAYKSFVPESVQEAIGSGVKSVLENPTVAGTIQDIGTAYGKFKQENPNLSKDIEGTANIAGLLPIGKISPTLGRVIKGTAEETGAIVADTMGLMSKGLTEEGLKTAERKVIENGFRKAGIKPKDPKMAEQFYEKATVAVPKIIENSSESIAKSSNPLETATQGIKETLRKIYKEYDDVIQTAGEEGLKPTNRIKMLEDILDPKSADYSVLSLNETGLKNELETLLTKLKGNAKKGIDAENPATAQQLQNLMQSYNEGANKFDFSKFKQRINARLHEATAMDLEDGLTSIGLKGRPDLLKDYGAVRSIQDQIAAKALKETGKVDISYLDILSAAGATHGLIYGSPELIVGALLTEGARQGVKSLKNPNRLVKDVFRRVEDLQAQQKGGLQSKTGQWIADKINPEANFATAPIPVKTPQGFPNRQSRNKLLEQGEGSNLPVKYTPEPFPDVMDAEFTGRTIPVQGLEGRMKIDPIPQLSAPEYVGKPYTVDFTSPEGTPYLPQVSPAIRLPEGSVPPQGLMERGRITQGATEIPQTLPLSKKKASEVSEPMTPTLRSEKKLAEAPITTEKSIVGKPESIKVIKPTKTDNKNVTTPKEQKKYLIDAIDEALKVAPDVPTTMPSRNKKQFDRLKKDDFANDKKLYEENKATLGTVTIEVPNDGTFTILNTKASLENFKKQTSKFPASVVKGTSELKTPLPTKRETGKRVELEGVSYYNEFKPRKQDVIPSDQPTRFNRYVDGYFTEGHYLLKTERPKGVKIEEGNPPNIKAVIPKDSDLTPAKIVAEFREGGSELEPAKVHIIAENGKEFGANAHFVDSVLTKHPDATVSVKTEGGNNPIVFKKGNEVVGIVMPLKEGAPSAEFISEFK